MESGAATTPHLPPEASETAWDDSLLSSLDPPPRSPGDNDDIPGLLLNKILLLSENDYATSRETLRNRSTKDIVGCMVFLEKQLGWTTSLQRAFAEHFDRDLRIFQSCDLPMWSLIVQLIGAHISKETPLLCNSFVQQLHDALDALWNGGHRCLLTSLLPARDILSLVPRPWAHANLVDMIVTHNDRLDAHQACLAKPPP